MFEFRKIGIVRRLSAWLLDAILLAVLATGIMYVVSLICRYEPKTKLLTEYSNAWNTFREENTRTLADTYGFFYEETEKENIRIERDGKTYEGDDAQTVLIVELVKDVAADHGFSCSETEGSVTLAFPDGRTATLTDLKNAVLEQTERDPMAELFLVYAELPPDQVVKNQARLVYSMLFMMISVGLAIAFLVLEFIVPVCLKNGQTVGKKVFSICIVRPDCVRAPTVALFARTVLGKFAIETMFPVLLIFLFLVAGTGLLSIILLAALVLLNIVLFFATKNRTPIHDIIAFTAAADMKEQMIFASEDERNEKRAEYEKMRATQEKSA